MCTVYFGSQDPEAKTKQVMQESGTIQEKYDVAGKKAFGDKYVQTTVTFDLEHATFTADGDVDEAKTPISFVNVEVMLPDAFSKKGHVDSFFLKSSELLKLTKDIQTPRIFIGAKADFVDTYGNKSESYAIKTEYPREELEKINFENFNSNNLPQLASEVWLAEALRTPEVLRWLGQ